jgi:hypothetical protein
VKRKYRPGQWIWHSCKPHLMILIERRKDIDVPGCWIALEIGKKENWLNKRRFTKTYVNDRYFEPYKKQDEVKKLSGPKGRWRGRNGNWANRFAVPS